MTRHAETFVTLRVPSVCATAALYAFSLMWFENTCEAQPIVGPETAQAVTVQGIGQPQNDQATINPSLPASTSFDDGIASSCNGVFGFIKCVVGTPVVGIGTLGFRFLKHLPSMFVGAVTGIGDWFSSFWPGSDKNYDVLGVRPQ